jgi:hypothetical protein
MNYKNNNRWWLEIESLNKVKTSRIAELKERLELISIINIQEKYIQIEIFTENNNENILEGVVVSKRFWFLRWNVLLLLDEITWKSSVDG